MVYFYPCSNTNHVYNACTYILLISTTFSFRTVFFFSIINVNGPIPSLAFKTHFFAVGLFVEDPNINKGVFLHSRIVKNIVTIQVVFGCFQGEGFWLLFVIPRWNLCQVQINDGLSFEQKANFITTRENLLNVMTSFFL